ncbi:uncharacterized protein SAPINGB_P006046 [Magnusiomyces paraingens]|uniref:Amino acid permease/ SLC12A domain-containing protein n=1 Tax=Magnusiomyces paraingens TaxID=2606893 RepID=A0A5E8C857_9ASCO|nr:uncharacterized protein SAPINGB_P006046 [Saprochaete ingens]VVT58118.1 unnamed protein product [Saprochaete ingens]
MSEKITTTTSATAGDPELTQIRSRIFSHTDGLERATSRASLEEQEDLKLAEMGYKPELRRNFSAWSLLGIGFGLTNSWFGISASLVTGIYSGGPLMIVYGILIIAFVSTFIGITLSELASAFPNSGGQYYWTMVLAPRKQAPFLAYMCGALAWAGSVFSAASTSMSVAQVIVGMHALLAGPDFVVKDWMVFVTFQIVNLVAFLFNCYGKLLPYFAKAALYISLISYFTITVTVLACSSGRYQSAHFVFVQFNNQTGWKSSGIAFIVGLINPNWCFSCLDSATHMAEEALEPERKIPIAIMGTVAIGFLTSFTYVIAMFFSVNNLDEIFNSNTLVPIIDIYYQALRNKGGTIWLMVMFLLTAFGCNMSGQTWMTRLCWSFSRDNGLLGSKYWSIIHPTLGVPLNANIMSCCWVAFAGCLYLVSTSGFNSMVVGTITFLLLSYAIPVVCLLLKGRNNIQHGPFWLGPLGYIANVITLLWTLFALVFFSFPFTIPVTKDNMNYMSVVIVGYSVWCVAYWFVRGHRVFKTTEMRLSPNGEFVEVEKTDDTNVTEEIKQ